MPACGPAVRVGMISTQLTPPHRRPSAPMPLIAASALAFQSTRSNSSWNSPVALRLVACRCGERADGLSERAG